MRVTRSHLFAAVLAGCAALSLAQAAEGINAGTITTSPPMVAYDASGTVLQGAIIDLAAAMSDVMGRRIGFTPLPFDGLIPAMDAGRIDIVFTVMNDTPEREERLDFVDFFNLSTMLLVKKGNPEHVESLETMCGKTVSTVRGSTQVALVDETSEHCKSAGQPAIENLQYAQPSDARLQVQTGHVAAFLGNSPVMVYLAKTANGGTLFDVVPGHEYQPVPLGIGVKKSDTALRDALQKALTTLMSNGTYHKILEKYGIEGGALKAAAINGGHDVKI